MKARVKWIEGVAFLGESGSGHAVVMDGPPDAGGRDVGIRPMEMVLLGLGGCACFDVMHILNKARAPVVDCDVEIEAERAKTEPKVFTRIHMHFIVTGDSLDERKVRRAVDLSAEKYCSVSAMLQHTAEMTHEVEIRSSDG